MKSFEARNEILKQAPWSRIRGQNSVARGMGSPRLAAEQAAADSKGAPNLRVCKYLFARVAHAGEG